MGSSPAFSEIRWGVWCLGCKALGISKCYHMGIFQQVILLKPHGGEGGAAPLRAAALGMDATSWPGSVLATGPCGKSEAS